MNCPNCNASVKPTAHFCGTCGYDLRTTTCPHCAAKVKPGSRFCPKCGASLETGGDGARKRFLVIGMLFLILFMVIGGAWWRFKPSPPKVVVKATSATTDPTPTNALETPTNEDELWNQARQAVNAGDLRGAASLLLEFHRQHPDYKGDEVLAQIESVCREWYDDAAQQANADVLEAGECLDEIGVKSPDDATWWERYFATKDVLSSGRVDEALSELESLADVAASDFAKDAHRNLLYEAYLKKGDELCAMAETDAEYKTARNWYAQARKLDPARTDAGKRLRDCGPPTPTPTVTPTPTYTPTPLPPDATIVARYTSEDARLNVRMGPGANYPIIDRVKAGAVFTVTGRAPDPTWLQALDIKGREVWVFAPLLETNYPAEAATVVIATPAPPTNYVVADSVADFRPQQGANRWFYLASKEPGSLEYVRIPREGGWFRWTKGGRSPQMRLSIEGSYPSWNSDAMRMWVNFYQGKLRIEGIAHKERGAGYGGNGVVVRIVQRRPNPDGSTQFEKQLWEYFLGPYDTSGTSIQVEPFEVEPRDEIYFITSALGNDVQDNTVFTARIILVNEGGIQFTPTPTPTVTPTKPPPPPLCFEPRLRHFEEHKGCCGEIVGLVRPSNGRIGRNWVIRIEGPPADNQYRRDFPVAADGGYEITALTAFPSDVYYTIWLRGYRVRSQKYVVRYTDPARIRAVVDFYQVACR